MSEKRTYDVLLTVVSAHGANVFGKVRVADVLKIDNSGIPNDLYKYALQSHFDFVVTDSGYAPQFAVEFDGPYHVTPVQRKRDQSKNDLCTHFELPLLRVNDDYLDKSFAQTDMLSWLANGWFCWCDYEKQKSLGRIDFYDTFDPRFVVSFPGCDREFPLWLSRFNQGWLRKQFFQERIPDFGASHVVVKAADGSFRAIAWILTSSQGGAVSRASMQAQRFPVGIREATEELALYGLKSKARDILDNGGSATSAADILIEVEELVANNEMKMAFFAGSLRPKL